MASFTPAELHGFTTALVLKTQVLGITQTAILYKGCLKHLFRLKSPACYELQWLFLLYISNSLLLQAQCSKTKKKYRVGGT